MKSLMRWLTGLPLAAFVTFCLFVLMFVLIKVEAQLDEKREVLKFDINPKVEDIKVAERETVIAQVREVVTPPPPPMIERQQAAQPTVAIASLEGAIPDFEAPKLDKKSFKIAVSDRDAQPLVRIPPVMPPRAEKSGHCTVRFDVAPDGQPFNVTATYCTQSVFKRATIKSVERWKYQPKIVDGIATSRSGVESKITFKLADENGRLIPE